MSLLSSLPSLAGKVFIVTGGNTGIGFATCQNLAARNARVYMGARSPEKASAAIANIKEAYPSADIHHLQLDHNLLATIAPAARAFLAKEKSLNGLILNAGIMAVPYEITKDGFESQLQVNYLAHWLLTQKLLPILLETSKSQGPGAARIVCVSSEGHQILPFITTKKMLYTSAEVIAAGPFGRYGLSKLANVLHAKTLTRNHGPGNGDVWSASLHPGFIDSQMNQTNKANASWKLKWIHPVLQTFGIMRPWDEGCVASLFVAASPEFTAELSGRYFDQKAKEKKCNPVAENVEEQERLENWTVERMREGDWI
jgi:NAD(P)-dependent dehydrogenase (short-subunit alcohol dehydrogenase family)